MAISTVNLDIYSFGAEGFLYDLPVAAAVHIYMGTLVAQLTASGYVVPFSTAASEHAVGVATHEQDNSAGANGAKRVRVESHRIYAFANGAGGDAFADTDFIGAPVYASDDHTVAKTSQVGTLKPIGTFRGFEADGKVRVFIDAAFGRMVAALGSLTDSPATADALRDNLVAKFAV